MRTNLLILSFILVDISEHAFDLLIDGYRSLMAAIPGYIVEKGEIGDLKRLEALFDIVGKQEVEILQKREEDVRVMAAKKRKWKKQSNEIVLSEEEMEEMEIALQIAYQEAIQDAMGSSATAGAVDEEYSTLKSDVPQDADEDEQISVLAKRDNVVYTKTPSEKSKKVGATSTTVKAEEYSEEVIVKDYRGRYYYEKFKIVTSSKEGKQFLDNLMRDYLMGLMWCLAYYTKGCISWTWYYPYHYGPMLKDMTNLESLSCTINFSLGAPFKPYQQLLGCLPPLSSNLVPKCYQWLMLSDSSPLKEYYPSEFAIDQDGKKNPWEAVVLLAFIDENRLLEAEKIHCPAHNLTAAELRRNQFGLIRSYVFDPLCSDTFPSPAGEVGLPAIPNCQSICTESTADLHPQHYFKAELMPGTTYPIAGFPSLAILAVTGFKKENAKVNVFGSDSKYKSFILEFKSLAKSEFENMDMEKLLDKVVYINYPQTHEAKVFAVSYEEGEVRLEIIEGKKSVKKIQYHPSESEKWRVIADMEENKYYKGRGVPGSAGLRIGEINIVLHVYPLQGLERNPATGATKKVYGTSEARVPIQLALWKPPVIDTRYLETEGLPVEKLFPYQSTVISLVGPLIGCSGIVVGPHSADDGGNYNGKRVVDIEFTIPPPEPAGFSYRIANSLVDDYFRTRDLCKALKISPRVLGRIVGTIPVEGATSVEELGLNFKRNGQYQLLGYCRKVDFSVNKTSTVHRDVWKRADTVMVVGSVANEVSDEDHAAAMEGAEWEYTTRAATLIYDYKKKFPALFTQLEVLPFKPVYKASQLFATPSAESLVKEIVDWLKKQPCHSIPRTPFSTKSLARLVSIQS